MKQADEIREFVYREYIKPARERALKEVTIRAGDVHKSMGLVDRMPAVTGALGTKIFEREYGVELRNRRGVTYGADVYFTFSLINDQKIL